MNGTIVGGWEYIWAAYLITWAAMAVYGGTLFFRAKKAQTRAPEKS